MNSDKIELAARALIQARKSRSWLTEVATDLRPSSAASAYHIQDAVRRLDERSLIGWKLGCTSAHVQQLLGSDRPIYGPLYADAVYRSPAIIPQCRTDMLLIEGEFAFRLGDDLPSRLEPYAKADVLAAIESVLPAVEIVEERYAHWQKSTIWEKIADNAGHGFVVLGEPLAVSDLDGLSDESISIRVSDEVKAAGKGSAVLGNPLNALMWLANELSSKGMGLLAGQIIMSGSCTGILAVPEGAPVTVDFGSGEPLSLTLLGDK